MISISNDEITTLELQCQKLISYERENQLKLSSFGYKLINTRIL